jgi:hypothetical protein
VSRPAWSYSRLTSLETCPRKFWHLNVQKDLKEEESEAMREGTATHKALELRVRDGKRLPLHLRHLEPVMAKICAAPGEKSVEQQIALDENLQITDWFSKSAWVRMKSDLTILNGPAAICFDYKTGKRKDEFTQLKLNAAVTMLLAPEIETVTMAFVWTKVNEVSSEKIHRHQMADTWGELMKRVDKYDAAYAKNDFPPKPNFFCAGCVVKTCQFWQPPKQKR